MMNEPMLESPGPIRQPLWFYIRKNPRVFLSGICTLAVTNFLDGIWPLWLKDAIDLLQSANSMTPIAKNAFVFFSILSSLAVTRFLWRIFFARFQLRSGFDLAERLFRKIVLLAPRDFQKSSVGDYLSLLTNDIQAFRQAMGPGLLIFADGMIIICVVLPIMFRLEPNWTWKSLSLLPAVPFLIWFIMKQIHIRYGVVQEELSRMTSFVQEAVNGVRVIKTFALAEEHMNVFQGLNRRLTELNNKVANVDSLFGPVMTIGVTTGNVILLFVAQKSLIAGTISVGTFIAFQRYINKMVWPLTALGMGLSMIQKGRTSMARINTELKKNSAIKQGTLQLVLPINRIEFKNITYTTAEGKTLLQDISFALEAKDRLAITGAVGSGKSILIQLLTRQIDASSGEILINDINIENFNLTSLRAAFALAPQDVFLFSTSIQDNITFSEPAKASDSSDNSDREQLLVALANHAANLAGLNQDILQFPSGLGSKLGEKGVNVSGGQKQRISLARAIYKNPQILILDDSLSAVDTETEKNIQTNLSADSASLFQIIVAHRISSLQHCNKVLVLRQGQCEYFGNWQDAEVNSPTLKSIMQIQGGHLVE